MACNTVLVTGASRGIGHAIAKDCQAKGMEVIGLSSKVPDNVDWTHYGVDLTAANSGNQLKEIIEKHLPARFVGNAGLLISGRLEDVNAEDFQRLMQINLFSLMQTCQLMMPIFEAEQFGRIVLIGSRAALGKEDRILYGPAKAAVASLGRSMALELARWQVTANTVAPGPIATELFNQGQPPGTPARIKIEANVPLGRVGDPAEIAAATSFFLSDEASYVTGQTLNVCGGLSVGFGGQ